MSWKKRPVSARPKQPATMFAKSDRRGVVQMRPNGMFDHYCAECGEWGAFGTGVNIRAGVLGTWYCADHLPK